MRQEAPYKWCSKCKTAKPVSEYSKRREGRGGLNSQCKECVKRIKSDRAPLYNTWRSMMSRCHNEIDKSYHRYGARGISVCKEWHEYANFERDMGLRPGPEYSIDRIDNSKGYSPDNCRWATPKEQQFNRSVTKLYEHDGEKLTLKQWSEKTGIPYGTLYNRINHLGWDWYKTITEPVEAHPPEHVFEYNGRMMTINELSALPECVISRRGLKARLLEQSGWSVSDAVTTPKFSRKEK